MIYNNCFKIKIKMSPKENEQGLENIEMNLMDLNISYPFVCI